MPADARVPGPPRETPPPARPFVAVLQRNAEQVELFYTADDPAAAARTVKSTDLPQALEQLWAHADATQGPSADPRQPAVLYVDDALPFAAVAPVLAALSASKERLSANGAREAFPAFEPTLAVAPPGNTLDLAGRQSHGPTVSGRLAPEVIQRVVRQHFGDYRRCYEPLLKKDPKSTGRVPMSFVIGRSGDVSEARVAEGVSVPGMAGKDLMPAEPKAPRLQNAQLERCLVAAFKKLKFPPPEGGVVNVVYPILFAPE